MNDIKIWLESTDADYNTGLAFFIETSKNRILINYLIRKRDLYKLRYELGKLVGCKAVATISPQSHAPAEVKPNERLRGMLSGKSFDDAPDLIRSIYKEIVSDYKRARSLHEQMKLESTDTMRAKCRGELLAIQRSNSQKWDLLDLWSETGELPVQQLTNDDKPLVGSLSVNEVNAASTSLSRLLNDLNVVKNAEKRAQKINRVKQDVAILQAAGIEFSEKRRAKLIELSIL